MNSKSTFLLALLLGTAFLFAGCEDPKGCVMGKLAKNSILTYRYSLRQLQANRTDIFENLCKEEFYPSIKNNQLRASAVFFQECIRTKGKSCQVPALEVNAFKPVYEYMSWVLEWGQFLCGHWLEYRNFDETSFLNMLNAMDQVDKEGNALQKKYCGG